MVEDRLPFARLSTSIDEELTFVTEDNFKLIGGTEFLSVYTFGTHTAICSAVFVADTMGVLAERQKKAAFLLMYTA